MALPFAHQNLALLDGNSGRELARVRATDEEIAYARALPEGIYYGGARGIYRLDDKSATGSRAGSSYAEAKLAGAEQVRTAYHWDGYQPAQSAIGAFDRNRLLWRGRDAGAGFRDDLAVLHSYRFFFAFDAKAGKLRWVYAHPRTDVVASEDAGTAIVFASADGDVGLIDPASGAVRVVQQTGLRVAGASFDADGVTAGAGAAPPTEEEVAQDARADRVGSRRALRRRQGLRRRRARRRARAAGVARAPQDRARRAGRGRPAAGGAEARRRGAGGAQGSRGRAAHARGARRALRLPRRQARRAASTCWRARSARSTSRRRRRFWPRTSAITRRPSRRCKDVAETLAHLGGADAEHALREFLLEYHADPAFLLDPAPLTAAGEALLVARPASSRGARSPSSSTTSAPCSRWRASCASRSTK